MDGTCKGSAYGESEYRYMAIILWSLFRGLGDCACGGPELIYVNT